MVLEAGYSTTPGAPNGPFPGLSTMSRWVNTPEGAAFVAATGWQFTGGQWIPPAGDPWTGYANPWEDAAEYGANFYDPGQLFTEATVQFFSPVRYAWAQVWLPR